MLNMRTRERPPATGGDDPATVSIEADTIEDALAELSERLGPDARILSADRIRRGGIAGFFAREVVELVAEAVPAPQPSPSGRPQPAQPEALAAAVAEPSPSQLAGGVAGAFAQLLEAAESNVAPVRPPTPVIQDQRLAVPEPAARAEQPAFERHRLSKEREVVAERPAMGRPATSPADGPAAPARPPSFGVSWVTAAMLELGLPDRLVRAVARLEPGDDMAHLAALADAISPACGPLPPGPARLVGRRAERLRNAVGITEARSGYLHLVVGDDDLPEMLPSAPLVVSWVTERGAAKAVSIALGTGAILGYGMSAAFGSAARRVTPVDAAIAIRELMERI